MNKIDKFLPFLMLEKGEDININGVVKRAIVSTVKDRMGFVDDKFIRLNSAIKTGTMVDYQNLKWIVLSEVAESRNSYKGKIRKCNYSFKIVINNKVEILDAIFNDYKNNIDVTGKLISVVDDLITFTVTESEITNSIKLQYRFIKFGNAWEILGKDYTQKGVISFTAKVVAINPTTDDKVNEIANVDKLKDQTLIDAQDLKTITDLSNTVVFTTTELSENLVIPAIISEDVTVNWTSSNPLNLSNIGVVIRPLETEPSTNATLTLTLQKGTQTITKDFLFTILAEVPIIPPTPSNSFTIEVKPTDVKYDMATFPYATTIEYNAIVKNNGIIDASQTVAFELINVVMAKLKLVSQNGISCTMSDTSYSAGTFTLKATLNSDISVSTEYNMKMRF